MPERKSRPWIPKSRKKTQPKQTNENWGKTSFYHSKEWRRLRAIFKAKNPLCVECAKKNRVVEMYAVDHIRSIKDGGAALDENNLQSLCKSCHARKTGRESRRRTNKINKN